MARQSLEDLRDFALYCFKMFQDILKAASDRNDASTFDTVLREFERSLRRFIERPTSEHVEILKIRLNQAAQEDRPLLEDKLAEQTKRQEIADQLILAREQVIFGLAARMLELYLGANDREARLFLLTKVLSSLPKDLTRLAIVFSSVAEYGVSDFWGWQWWDFVADGEAHFVDTRSRPNRLFCVKALQLLARLDAHAIANITLPASETLASLAEEQNVQGLHAMLKQISEKPEPFTPVLGQIELDRTADLAALLRKVKAAHDSARENTLIVAALDSDKLNTFKQSVIGAFRKSGRLRPLMAQMGSLSNPVPLASNREVQSLGYNQLDDKGAFIADWHVSYTGWGEEYGRGLAQSEDQAVFAEMVRAAQRIPAVRKYDLIPAIEMQIQNAKLKRPVVIQSLRHLLEFEDMRKKELFISCYRNDCPSVRTKELDAFIGVFKFGDEIVPVFDLFVLPEELNNRVLIADLARFSLWQQFLPVDEAGEEQYVIEGLFIRVNDLNSNDALRQKIIAENPPWLRDKPDAERFLRTHVVVYVYEKFKLDIVDSAAAVCIPVDAE